MSYLSGLALHPEKQLEAPIKETRLPRGASQDDVLLSNKRFGSCKPWLRL